MVLGATFTLKSNNVFVVSNREILSSTHFLSSAFHFLNVTTLDHQKTAGWLNPLQPKRPLWVIKLLKNECLFDTQMLQVYYWMHAANVYLLMETFSFLQYKLFAYNYTQLHLRVAAVVFRVPVRAGCLAEHRRVNVEACTWEGSRPTEL